MEDIEQRAVWDLGPGAACDGLGENGLDRLEVPDLGTDQFQMVPAHAFDICAGVALAIDQGQQGADLFHGEAELPWAATCAGVLGALAMTSCCILPLVLVSFGVTGVFIGQLTALYAYKWVTFSVAAAALGFGSWRAYRPVPAEHCGIGTCARPIDRALMRGLLWGALVVVLLALAFPSVAPLILTF